MNFQNCPAIFWKWILEISGILGISGILVISGMFVILGTLGILGILAIYWGDEHRDDKYLVYG